MTQQTAEDERDGVKNLPSLEFLKAIIDYDAEAGKMYWKPRPQGMFKDKRSWATRVLWKLAYGNDPNGQIDHIDGDKGNNAIENLRVVQNQENAKNAKLNCKSTTGVTGVYWVKKSSRWTARITVDGKMLSLGCFATKDEAISARKLSEIEYGFHPNHGRAPL